MTADGGPAPGADAHPPDRGVYEDFSRLNNELTNLQRELVRKNVELAALVLERSQSLALAEHAAQQLQESEQRYRSLNAELEMRVSTRTEEFERARKEAEKANQAKSDFLAMMSHEIRTPMNGVIGMLDILKGTELSNPQREMADLANESARSLLGIINDILDFSKVEAGELELDEAAFELEGLVGKVCAMLRPVAMQKGCTISVSVDRALPRVLGDEARLRQVLVNLLGNAIKFSEGAGRPGLISVRATLVGRYSEAVDVTLTVADRGIGMSEATLAKVFKPFAQADASITRRYGGTGLGLSITAMLVRMMKGRITVDTQLGQGTTFTIHLRLALADETQVLTHDPTIATGRPALPTRDAVPEVAGLILVAEDNDVNRKVIVHQLRSIGYAAEVACDGREALERWRRGRFDAVLTDLHMPEMDGYALVAAIRAEESSEWRIPVIALTADALSEVESRCLDTGMDAYLTKPVASQRLKATLLAVGAKARALRGA